MIMKYTFENLQESSLMRIATICKTIKYLYSICDINGYGIPTNRYELDEIMSCINLLNQEISLLSVDKSYNQIVVIKTFIKERYFSDNKRIYFIKDNNTIIFHTGL